ncbi:MAG: ribosome silencing factor [Clostridia bacterium]|nr:ribosome silencing factor [Clostridia bacterium]MBQ2378176.1 ribosome silencing factor [Clostridia bacterium]
MEELFKLGDLSEAEVEDIAKAAATVLDNKKGIDVKIIPVASKIDIVDYFVICSGTSNTHIKALADEVEYQLVEAGVKLKSYEGRGNNTWILVDFGEVVVHVFSREARDFYNIEKLYREAVSPAGEQTE